MIKLGKIATTENNRDVEAREWWVAREPHVEVLAKRLHSKIEHLDPCFGDDWEALPENDKDFFRECIEFVVLDAELLKPFMTEQRDRPDEYIPVAAYSPVSDERLLNRFPEDTSAPSPQWDRVVAIWNVPDDARDRPNVERGPSIEVSSDFENLLACYRSGQVSEAQWQKHQEDEAFRVWLLSQP